MTAGFHYPITSGKAAVTYTEAHSDLRQIARDVRLATGPLGRLEAFKGGIIRAMQNERSGWLSRDEIVDEVQQIAETTGLVDEFSVGTMQVAMASAIELGEQQADDLPASQLSEIRSVTSSRLISHRASDLAPERVDWLWPGRIAVGKLTLIGGPPGLGKSQLATFLASAVSSGNSWPCNEGRADLGNVIIFSAEDGLRDTIIPRLMAAGADMSRVHVVTGVQDKGGRRGFDLKADIAALETAAKNIGDVRLITIDPISAYLGSSDGNDNVKTRAVLEPVAEMADRLRIAVLAITHLNKGSAGAGGQSALNRFVGSIAMIAAARAAFAVLEDKDGDGRRLFLSVKNNLAKTPDGLAFRVGQTMLPGDIIASYISFDPEPVDVTANEALAASEENSSGGHTNKEEAAEFLKMVLAAGPLPAKEVERQAVDAGLLKEGQPIGQCKPMRAARKELGVETHKEGFGEQSKFIWSLPKPSSVPSASIDALSGEGHR